MSEIIITCDRCGKTVHGLRHDYGTAGVCTAGYYELSGCWEEYRRWEEERICDECMHSDPQYKKRYPGATVPMNRATASLSK